MKRSFLDMIYTVGRSTKRVTLSPIDFENELYWIFGTSEWVVDMVLPEMQSSVDVTDKFTITINQQFIPNKYYIIDTYATGINIKFIKNILPYLLDETDTIVLKGDIRKYV